MFLAVWRMASGTSLRTNDPVAERDRPPRLPATFELAAAMLVAIVIAIPLGIVRAASAGTVVDHAAMTLALLGISMPNFWLGPLLAIVFAVELGWLPVSGRGTLAQLVLPAISLGAALAAVLARMTRGQRHRRVARASDVTAAGARACLERARCCGMRSATA